LAQLLVKLNKQDYPCEIKHSTRAKYLRLKLSHSGTLSVVVPKGVAMGQVKAFVISQAAWVESKVSELPPGVGLSHKPNRFNLAYINEDWSLDYLPNLASSSIKLTVNADYRLECSGETDDTTLLHNALGGWLKSKAEVVIPERLALLAQQHGFHFNNVSIRGQKTRWGSCSSKKNINLNYKLLFLKPKVADYVLIHELCHTIEMNHSKQFWDLVADCDPLYRSHDKQLNVLSKTLPF